MKNIVILASLLATIIFSACDKRNVIDVYETSSTPDLSNPVVQKLTNVTWYKQVGIEIHSGKNRIVRRIFEHLGYRVIKLDRVQFAGLTKKNLRRGDWRFLTEKEVDILRMGAFE